MIWTCLVIGNLQDSAAVFGEMTMKIEFFAAAETPEDAQARAEKLVLDNLPDLVITYTQVSLFHGE